MSDASASEVPPLLRSKHWPAFFVVLIVILNVIAVVLLYADIGMRRDGQPAADMVRDAFMGVARLNLIFAALALGSMYLLSRARSQE